jgi:hypothetical protein
MRHRNPPEAILDCAVATRLLEQELARARQRGHGGLKADVGEEVTKQIAGPDGKNYQMSVLIVWDAEENCPCQRWWRTGQIDYGRAIR